MKMKINTKGRLLVLNSIFFVFLFRLNAQEISDNRYLFNLSEITGSGHFAEYIVNSKSFQFGDCDIFYHRDGPVKPNNIHISIANNRLFIHTYRLNDTIFQLVESKEVDNSKIYVLDSLLKKTDQLKGYEYNIIDKHKYFVDILNFYKQGILKSNIVTVGVPILDFSKYNIDLSNIKESNEIEKIVEVFLLFNQVVGEDKFQRVPYQ